MHERKDPNVLRLIAQRHREWGIRFIKSQRTKAAFDAFERSLEESEQNDLRTLLGLCETLVKSTRYSEAEKLSARCLEIGEII